MGAQFLIVAVIALAIASVARRFGWQSPLLLVVCGFGIGWIPGLPDFTLNPDVVLFIILPPLLYVAAQESSYVALRRNTAAIASLAVLLPVFTMICVAVAGFYAVPQLTWSAAFVLGAVVAPPDAVSAQAVGRRAGLPRRMMTLLGGESLFNDATALTALRLALAAVLGTATTPWGGLLLFAQALAGGLLIGLVVAMIVTWVRHVIDDPSMETAIGVIVPFGTYLIADELGASGVIAVVTAGVYLGQRSARAGYKTRLQENAVWKAIEVILESFVFLLIGLQLPGVIDGLRGHSAGIVMIATAAVFATVIVSRFVWVFPATYLTHAVSSRRTPKPTPRQLTVISWAGMRGVVTLAAAFAVPRTIDGQPFPARDEIVFLAFVVVVGTLLLQGTTLPWLINKLSVRGDDYRHDLIAVAAASDRASRAAERRLDELAAEMPAGDPRQKQVELIRRWLVNRKNSRWEDLGRSADEIGESPSETFNRLRTTLIGVQREAFVEERDAGRIDDEVLRRVLWDLDLAEGMAERENHARPT